MATPLLVALRRLAILLIVVIFALIAAVLAYGNQEPIAIDIGIMRLENVSLAVALTLSFVAGAGFGAIFCGLTLLRHVRERRALKRELLRAENELQTLRSLPVHDAD